MTVTMVSVMSLDGRGTKWDQPGDQWASPEDQDRFATLKSQNDVLVMGRKTWDAAKARIQLSRNPLRVVLTRTPGAHSADQKPEMLEFTNDSPAALLARMKALGRERVLLVGGAETNAEFLAAGVVDEVVTTVEPTIFGDGRPVVWSRQLNVSLVLQSSETLNSRGTLLLHYRVDRSTTSDK